MRRGDGMGIKNYSIIFIIVIACLLPLFSIVSSDDNIIIDIHIVKEKSRTRFDNPIIVAGIWHYINITIEDNVFDELILKLFEGDIAPLINLRNETNYYEWNYNSNNDLWSDVNEYEGYSYINNTGCQKKHKMYSFYVGIKDTLPEITNYYKNWSLEIYRDTNQLYSTKVVIEKPLVGLAKSHADIVKFDVEPYTEKNIRGKDYSTIKNVGNIPLNITFNYEKYNDIIEITNLSRTLSPDKISDHYIYIQTSSWKPGILDISGSVTGSIPSYLIITTAIITLPTTVEINAPDLEISVGHSNYKIQIIPDTNIVFQYEKIIEINEGQKKDVTVYVSGEGETTLNILSDEKNIAILKITGQDHEGSPLTIISTNLSEYSVTIQIEGLRENKIGVIYYELLTNGLTQTYSTQVNVGPPLTEETYNEITTSITTIIVVLCIIFVIGYIIFTQIKHKRR